MTTENDAPTQDQPEPGSSFTEQPWQVMIGLRVTSDPATPNDMNSGLLIDMVADVSVMVSTPQGPRPDKTNEAVHFAGWINENKAHLVALWRAQYVQYMNLRMATQRGIPGLRVVGADELPQAIVGQDGRPVQ